MLGGFLRKREPIWHLRRFVRYSKSRNLHVEANRISRDRGDSPLTLLGQAICILLYEVAYYAELIDYLVASGNDAKQFKLKLNPTNPLDCFRKG